MQAWHVLDTSFEIPKASLQIQLTNFAVERSARGAVALRMVLEMVQELTNEDAYQAEEAGLVFDITNTSNSAPCVGLRLSFKGYDQCMPTLVGNIAAFLARLQVAEHQVRTAAPPSLQAHICAAPVTVASVAPLCCFCAGWH